ncbi:DUF4054 domain-containing protein [Sphingomonas faeni]|uniref:DUF4054 domain-containing protein n=1 Tax=Sphingomonas faeni TaxID=185950 RepID=UPI00335FDE99
MLAHLLPTIFASAIAPPDSDLVAKLRRRYAAFRNVDAADIAYWLDDAGRIVTEDWGTDYEPGLLSLAAHNMSINGVPGITLSAAQQLPAGVTRFRSASMDVAVSNAAANRSVSGGYSSTIYGQEFAVMLRRNRGGPRLVGYVEPRGICWS